MEKVRSASDFLHFATRLVSQKGCFEEKVGEDNT